MLRFASLLALIHSALTCSPGAGSDTTIVTNPKFEFTFYPPVGWTFYSGTPPTGVDAASATHYPGQQLSLADAKRVMKNEIDTAILKALNDLGVTSQGTTWTITGYTPESYLIRADNGQAGWRAVGTYVPQIGAVVARRTTVDSDTGTDNAKDGTLQVTTTNLVTRAQWNYIATEVYNYLSVNSKVYFLSAIELV
ncbi:hypothetical protein Q1695_002489 [Nippostrongylus brasiliensis]|nr:hypothetical protein Q1695_002489 [Nippostrongylus brasiliensis]